MKKILQPSLIVLIVALVAMFGFRSSDTAPTARVGYMSINAIVTQLPDYANSQGALDTMIYEFNVVLQAKLAEFKQKEMAYLKDSAKFNVVVKEDKLRELQNLSQSIQAFKQVSEEEVRKQDSLLVKPILDGLQQAIDQVAMEKGFTLIMNTDVRAENGPAMVLYADETNDVSDLVLESYLSSK